MNDLKAARTRVKMLILLHHSRQSIKTAGIVLMAIIWIIRPLV
jgi:hypothetical protein